MKCKALTMTKISNSFQRFRIVGICCLIFSAAAQAQLSGELRTISKFHSLEIEDRRIDIWKPANVSEGPYQLLIMHDGQMLFQADSTWNGQEWGVDECLDSLYDQSLIGPTLVVGIWNIPERRHQNYFPQKAFESLPEAFKDSVLQLERPGEERKLLYGSPNSDAYLRFIFKELLPWVKSEYPIQNNGVYMMGSSMGGLISMYAALEYPYELKGVACMSTHWPGFFQNENNPVPDAFINYIASHEEAAAKSRWYFDRGDASLDALYPPHQDRVDSLFHSWPIVSVRDYKSLVAPGDPHWETAWRSRLPMALIYLMGRSRE